MPVGQVQTIGQVLVKDAIPKTINLTGALNKKSVKTLFEHIAVHYPDQYADILLKLSNIGRHAATEYGGSASLSLDDLILPKDMEDYRTGIKNKISAIVQDPKLSGEAKNQKVTDELMAAKKEIQTKLVDSTSAANNAFGLSIKHGFRGSPVQLQQLLFGDVLNADNNGNPIPIPGLTGYGEGVSPVQYWSGAYSSRSGYSAVQFATADAGYFSRQLDLMANRVKVTGGDCGALGVGVKRSGDDQDILGSELAKDAGGLKAGTILDRNTIKKVAGQDVLVRSVITCQQDDGVCQHCAGLRESGKLPSVGDYIGKDSARGISEPMTQMGLCLAKGTLVRMGDHTVKAIEDIKIGDCVLGADKDAIQVRTQVVAVYANGFRDVSRYTFGTKKNPTLLRTLEATKDHKVLCQASPNNLLIPLRMVQEDTIVLGQKFKEGHENVLLHVEDLGVQETYDIEVSHPDHLFILHNGLVVANSAKHTGGLTKNQDEVSGFEEIDRFFQIPERFASGSVLAPQHGNVTEIRPAAQGGNYLRVNDAEVYIPKERELLVKKGDYVEAGDMLSDGTPNPAEIARYKGLGEGRKYFADKVHELYKKNGIDSRRRNTDVLAKAFFNRVTITDPDGFMGHEPGDIMFYSALAKDYEPRPGFKEDSASRVKGWYLERPYLHYSIGTEITPSVIKTLKDNDIENVTAHPDKPGFEPEISRMEVYSANDPDWKTRLAGSGLQKSFIQSATKGSFSPYNTTSIVPTLMDPGRKEVAPQPTAG